MEDIGFLFWDPGPAIFSLLTMTLLSSKSMYFINPMHLSQAALTNECPFDSAKVNVLSINF